jgi:hypothetical protein
MEKAVAKEIKVDKKKDKEDKKIKWVAELGSIAK